MFNKDIYKELYNLVEKSNSLNEIPVGAIVIYNNEIIGKGYNDRQTTNNICGHAEVNAIIEAEKYLNDWRLNSCILISTLKPCNMCKEIINSSRIEKVYYIIDQDGVSDSDLYIKVTDDNEYLNKISNIFKNFFQNLR